MAGVSIGGNVLYHHYSSAPWDAYRWPNFTAQELSCNHCGEYYHDTVSFDALQALRTSIQAPLQVNSGHRCPVWNARVGGAPLSQHKAFAADLHIGNHERHELRNKAVEAGFKGFGFYQTFLHMDMGRPRYWFGGDLSKAAWGDPTDNEVRQWL
jgi:hypothetical protein